MIPRCSCFIFHGYCVSTTSHICLANKGWRSDFADQSTAARVATAVWCRLYCQSQHWNFHRGGSAVRQSWESANHRGYVRIHCGSKQTNIAGTSTHEVKRTILWEMVWRSRKNVNFYSILCSLISAHLQWAVRLGGSDVTPNIPHGDARIYCGQPRIYSGSTAGRNFREGRGRQRALHSGPFRGSGAKQESTWMNSSWPFRNLFVLVTRSRLREHVGAGYFGAPPLRRRHRGTETVGVPWPCWGDGDDSDWFGIWSVGRNNFVNDFRECYVA